MRLAAAILAGVAVVATVRWRAEVARELRAIRRRLGREGDDDDEEVEGDGRT